MPASSVPPLLLQTGSEMHSGDMDWIMSQTGEEELRAAAGKSRNKQVCRERMSQGRSLEEFVWLHNPPFYTLRLILFLLPIPSFLLLFAAQLPLLSPVKAMLDTHD